VDDGWFNLPFVDQPLTSVTHVGSGKDADMIIEFTDGRRLTLVLRPVNDLTMM
jgi:hypothetical protein